MLQSHLNSLTKEFIAVLWKAQQIPIVKDWMLNRNVLGWLKDRLKGRINLLKLLIDFFRRLVFTPYFYSVIYSLRQFFFFARNMIFFYSAPHMNNEKWDDSSFPAFSEGKLILAKKELTNFIFVAITSYKMWKNEATSNGYL